MQFAYGNVAPEAMLKKLGEQTVVGYLVSSTMDDLMASGRGDAEAALKKNLQQLADQNSLGVEIIRVAIMDAHPPVEQVAPAYQNVIGALEEKETMILKAQSYAAKTVPAAQSTAEEIVEDAKAYQYKIRTVARAESERFGKQLTTYNMMPSMFKLKAYLDFLENDCQNVRKYVVSSNLRNEVYELNLEEKERIDLVDTDLTAVSQP
jgi:membrane protease subunit HflK